MFDVLLFVEDKGHEDFLRALLLRIATESNVTVNIMPYSVRGGHGKVFEEYDRFLKDLQNDRAGLPSFLIVATDSNCQGLSSRLNEVNEHTPEQLRDIVVCAIPDPHAERWMLVDSNAFKVVFGKGCKAPDLKCTKDRYKSTLMNAVMEAGIIPSLGGMEYADEIVAAMDLDKIKEDSLSRVIKEIRRRFK